MSGIEMVVGVDHWITEKEYLDITGNKYKKA